MNVLSPSTAPSSAQTAAVLSPAAAAQPGAASTAQEAFAQVWGQQTTQTLADQLVAEALAQPAVLDASNTAEAALSDMAQTAPVDLAVVVPAMELPAAESILAAQARQQLAAHAALALDDGEVLEQFEAEDAALPAMQNLSALQTVHAQLRRSAVVATTEASIAPGQLQGSMADAIGRTSVPLAALAPAPSAAPVVDAPVPTAAAPAAKYAPVSPLVQALGQRIQLQQAQGQDVVTVRLDPPQWGRIEIRIQQDAAGMQVVLQASHAEVGRQLTSVADALRQELQARTNGEASVVVAHSQRGMAGQGQGERHAQQGDEAWAGEAPVGQALQFDMGDGAV